MTSLINSLIDYISLIPTLFFNVFFKFFSLIIDIFFRFFDIVLPHTTTLFPQMSRDIIISYYDVFFEILGFLNKFIPIRETLFGLLMIFLLGIIIKVFVFFFKKVLFLVAFWIS